MILIFDGQRVISGFLGVGICQSLNELNDLSRIFPVTNLIGDIVGG